MQCLQWIKHSIDKEINFSDLAGIELPVNHVKHLNADKRWIQSFEVDNLAHADALCKKERYDMMGK